MNQPETARLANELLMKHDLDDWTFGFDNAKARFGATHFRTKTITLSRVLLPYRSDGEIKMTLLHEVAHVLAGHKAGHGPKWRAICLSIGGDGKRCGADSGARERLAPYAVVCTGGGEELGHVYRLNFRVKGRKCRTHATDIHLIDRITKSIVKA